MIEEGFDLEIGVDIEGERGGLAKQLDVRGKDLDLAGRKIGVDVFFVALVDLPGDADGWLRRDLIDWTDIFGGGVDDDLQLAGAIPEI